MTITPTQTYISYGTISFRGAGPTHEDAVDSHGDEDAVEVLQQPETGSATRLHQLVTLQEVELARTL